MADQYESEYRTVWYDGTCIDYQLKRKEVKNLNLRIRPDGTVLVSANPAVPETRIDALISSKGGIFFRR